MKGWAARGIMRRTGIDLVRVGQVYHLAPPGGYTVPGGLPGAPISSQSTYAPGVTPSSTPYGGPSPPQYPPCIPVGGNEVMVAGETTINAAEAGGNDEIVFNFAGSFCMRRLFLFDATGAAVLTGLLIGAKDIQLGGNIPVSVFASSAEGCCPVFNSACVCGPGIPLTLKLRSTANGLVRAVLFGEYCEACP